MTAKGSWCGRRLIRDHFGELKLLSFPPPPLFMSDIFITHHPFSFLLSPLILVPEMSCNISTKELFVEEGNSSSGGGGDQNIFAESVVVSYLY